MSLPRRFVEEQLVARGMIADIAIHDPKKAKDKNPESPYAHHGSHPPFKGRWHLGTEAKKGSGAHPGRAAGFESERAAGISGGTYNGLGRKETLEELRSAWARIVQ